jgi:hypothetical protein
MLENRAASDDSRGPLVAEATMFAADCANRDAYAEVAPAESKGKRLRTNGAATQPPSATAAATTDKSKAPPEFLPPPSFFRKMEPVSSKPCTKK